MISRACYVACDRCHSPAAISTRDAKEARAYALQEGFVRVRESGTLRDICPACQGVRMAPDPTEYANGWR